MTDLNPSPGNTGPLELLDEIIGHLGASIIQSIPTDDQIIMDHVKVAHELAKAARRQLKVPA